MTENELRKSTEELLEELKFNKTDIQEYINSNADSLIEINLKNFWTSLVEKSNMSKSDIINKADIGYVYFYDIINGKKIPSTDKIVRLILAMGLDIDDCQNIIKYCGKSPLYPRIKRDSILIYSITHNKSVIEANELLTKAGESELK